MHFISIVAALTVVARLAVCSTCGNTGEAYTNFARAGLQAKFGNTPSTGNLASFFMPQTTCTASSAAVSQVSSLKFGDSAWTGSCTVVDPASIQTTFAASSTIAVAINGLWSIPACVCSAVVAPGSYTTGVSLSVNGDVTVNMDNTAELSGCSLTLLTGPTPLANGSPFSISYDAINTSTFGTSILIVVIIVLVVVVCCCAAVCVGCVGFRDFRRGRFSRHAVLPNHDEFPLSSTEPKDAAVDATHTI